jgi:hypothetical protein
LESKYFSFPSTGLYHRAVQHAVTDGLEEPAAYIFAVEMKMGEVDVIETSANLAGYTVSTENTRAYGALLQHRNVCGVHTSLYYDRS